MITYQHPDFISIFILFVVLNFLIWSFFRANGEDSRLRFFILWNIVLCAWLVYIDISSILPPP